MPITQGKTSRIVQGPLGSAGASSGITSFPAPPAGVIYIIDWLNVLVRDATANTAYAEIWIASFNADQGNSPILLNVALVSSGLPSNLGTYSIFLQGLGIPVFADGSSSSLMVTLRDVTGAASATTAVNGQIIYAAGLKQYPYQGYVG